MEGIKRSFKVTLHIDHLSIEPEKISAQLGLVPRHQHHVGQPRVTPRGESLEGNYQSSHWSHRFDVTEVQDLSEFLPSIIIFLKPHAEFFADAVQSGGRIELFCGIFADGNWDENFPHALLRDFSELNIDLRLDVYPRNETGGDRVSFTST